MTTTTYYSYIDCPLGRMFVQGDGQFVTGLFLPHHKGWRGPDAAWQQSDAPFAAVREQLAEYFAGERQQFDVPLKLAGTPFQQRVWQELVRIPFGTTITYAQLAHAYRQADRFARRGPRQRPQSHFDHRAVPSRDRRRWEAYGLRRRRRQEAVVARLGASHGGRRTCGFVRRSGIIISQVPVTGIE